MYEHIYMYDWARKQAATAYTAWGFLVSRKIRTVLIRRMSRASAVPPPPLYAPQPSRHSARRIEKKKKEKEEAP